MIVLALISLAFATIPEPVLFPLPKQYTPGTAVTLGNFVANVKVNAANSNDISNAKRYLKNLSKYIFYDDLTPSGVITSIETTINSKASYPVEADQSYNISFSGSKIIVNAGSIYGAYYAYETIGQLIKFDEDQKLYYIYQATITDAPRFKWRGIHIDTARHFHPLSSIKRQILAIAASKMNVLHWHIADAESFSWKPDTVPDIAKGAYKSGRLFYTSQDIKNVINFANMWGVHVYIEVDTPGHTYSWKYGYPDLVANCPSKSSNINNVALDISKDETYDIVSSLYNELYILTGKYIHMGGDEVVTSCWKEDPDTSAMMTKYNTDGYGIWTMYETKIDSLVEQEVVPIFWQEVFQYKVGENVRKTAIFQSWEDQKTLGDIVKAGYRGILSGGWYLDKQIPALDSTTHYGFYETWEDFYNNEPTKGLNLTEDQENLILGGEACMWGEAIDAGAIDTFLWPRTLAVSERLWVPKSVTDTNSAKTRIQAHRCVLLRRGIGAGPIGPNEPCEGQFEHWNYTQYNEN